MMAEPKRPSSSWRLLKRMPRLALFVVFILLLPGCAGPSAPTTEEFRALSMKAPALLRADLGPGGNLTRVEGKTIMHVTIVETNRTVRLDTVTDSVQEYYQDGSFLVSMQMHESMPGMTMNMTMHVFCSPTKLTFRSDDGGFGAAVDESFPNTTGKCDMSSGDPKELFQGMDPDDASQWEGVMGQGAVPALNFKTVVKEGSTDVAVYETSLDMAEDGMGVNMTVETRATLEGGRISHLTMTGTGGSGGDAANPVEAPETTSAFTLDAAMDFHYGIRGLPPAEYS